MQIKMKTDERDLSHVWSPLLACADVFWLFFRTSLTQNKCLSVACIGFSVFEDFQKNFYFFANMSVKVYD